MATPSSPIAVVSEPPEEVSTEHFARKPSYEASLAAGGIRKWATLLFLIRLTLSATHRQAAAMLHALYTLALALALLDGRVSAMENGLARTPPMGQVRVPCGVPATLYAC